MLRTVSKRETVILPQPAKWSYHIRHPFTINTLIIYLKTGNIAYGTTEEQVSYRKQHIWDLTEQH